MGIYSEYLDRQWGFSQLTEERKRQLQRISQLRGGRDVLVFAADMSKMNAPISITYSDLLPIADQLSNLHGKGLDLILETPGGAGEVAEDIVKQLHQRHEEVAVVIPGWAKSAGTIMAMAGDEILMEPSSALGPIDAQIAWQGKVFSADALIEGMDKIKEEVARTGALNKAYIPMLQGISPGELQSAKNALKFAKTLVTEWLVSYKFKGWAAHSSTGKPVTEKQRRKRAEEIAERLCDHRHWLTHGRSIKLPDLVAMGLRIVDYSEQAELADAIRRYYTLLQMTFAGNIYKLVETPTSQVYRFMGAQVPAPPDGAELAFVDAKCSKCGKALRVQANLGRSQPTQPGALPFPADNRLTCPTCGNLIDLSEARRQIEAQAKKQVVS